MGQVPGTHQAPLPLLNAPKPTPVKFAQGSGCRPGVGKRGRRVPVRDQESQEGKEVTGGHYLYRDMVMGLIFVTNLPCLVSKATWRAA